MDFSVGDNVKYRFPEPSNNRELFFKGKIENISESFVFIKNEENIRLKVSFKNFEFLLPDLTIYNMSYSRAEDYSTKIHSQKTLPLIELTK